MPSYACWRAWAACGGLRRFAAVLCMIPRGLRDIGYRLIARNRYRWPNS
ncbi:DCC1-like thiol-disulfide oxidoreductase family protein [Xanthomonas oryzae]